MAMREVEALSRGLDVTSINNLGWTRIAVEKVQVRSQTRIARSWGAVGNSLRESTASMQLTKTSH